MTTNRNRMHRLALEASNASVSPKPTVMTELTNQLFLHFHVEVSVADLVATIGLRIGSDVANDDPATMPALLYDKVEALTALPTGFTYAGSGAALWTIASPTGGTHRFSARIINPPTVFVPVYTYTSGTGTISVKVKAVY